MRHPAASLQRKYIPLALCAILGCTSALAAGVGRTDYACGDGTYDTDHIGGCTGPLRRDGAQRQAQQVPQTRAQRANEIIQGINSGYQQALRQQLELMKKNEEKETNESEQDDDD